MVLYVTNYIAIHLGKLGIFIIFTSENQPIPRELPIEPYRTNAMRI